MKNVSGLRDERDFASHGNDIFTALELASPRRLAEFGRLLDFGCGCGRLARMFRGHPHEIFGCDIDERHVRFINQSFDYMTAKTSGKRPPLPFANDYFDAVISISVFTHLNERSQDEFLADLRRISAPGALLFLTVHGARALRRAIDEEPIWNMISVDRELFEAARRRFLAGEHGFVLQHGHLTQLQPRSGWLDKAKMMVRGKSPVQEPFEYGITFIPEPYIRRHWIRWFELVDYRQGAIHDFQDIVVLRPRK